MSDFFDHLLGPVLQTVPLFQPRPTARFESRVGPSTTHKTSHATAIPFHHKDGHLVTDVPAQVTAQDRPLTAASHAPFEGHTSTATDRHEPHVTSPAQAPLTDSSSVLARPTNHRSVSQQDAYPNSVSRDSQQTITGQSSSIPMASPLMSQKNFPQGVSLAMPETVSDSGQLKTSGNAKPQSTVSEKTIQATPVAWPSPDDDHGSTSQSPVVGDHITQAPQVKAQPAGLTHESKTSPDHDGNTSQSAPVTPTTKATTTRLAKPIEPSSTLMGTRLDTSNTASIVSPNDSSMNNPVPPADLPSVRVTIGRVEVRAATPAKASPHRAAPRASMPNRPTVSLNDYLTRRRGGNR